MRIDPEKLSPFGEDRVLEIMIDLRNRGQQGPFIPYDIRKEDSSLGGKEAAKYLQRLSKQKRVYLEPRLRLAYQPDTPDPDLDEQVKLEAAAGRVAARAFNTSKGIVQNLDKILGLGCATYGLYKYNWSYAIGYGIVGLFGGRILQELIKRI